MRFAASAKVRFDCWRSSRRYRPSRRLGIFPRAFAITYTLDVVVHEAILHTVIGGRRVMSAQLRHLADLSTRPNITLRVLPFGAGIPGGNPTGPFAVLDPRQENKNGKREPRVVYAPGYTGDMYLEKEHLVRRYERAYEAIRQASDDAVNSRNRIRYAASAYESQR
ncbi:DUF5753 domain-containing protein [Nocardia callitridis]